MSVSDGVVTLSPLGLDDAAAHLAGEDEELVRWLSGGPGSEETVRVYLRRCVEQWTTGGPVHAFGVRVQAHHTGVAATVLAGTVEVQFDRLYLDAGQVNISYGLYPAWRGRGLATRAVALACVHAASSGALCAVVRAEPQNLASVAVALRAGFTYYRQSAEGDGVRLHWYRRDLPHAHRPTSGHRPG